jgi:hypothetical protein
MRLRLSLLVLALVLLGRDSQAQTLVGNHNEVGIVIGAFSGGIFNFHLPPQSVDGCSLPNATLFLNLGDPNSPVPLECGLLTACQCWALSPGSLVSITGRIYGNGMSPGSQYIFPVLHVATISTLH